MTSDVDPLPSERDAVEIVDLASGSRRVIFRFSFPPGAFPSLSPDGRILAMQQRRSGALVHEIHLFDIKTRHRTVYRHMIDDRNPVWLRDGSGFVFLSDGPDKSGLWMQPFKTRRVSGRARLLIAGFDSEMMSTFNRDDSLYYRSNRGRSAVVLSQFDSSAGKTVGISRRLTDRIPGECLSPSWSPNGNSVAFISVQKLSGQPQAGKLVVLTGEQAVVHNLDFGVSRGTGASWSSDGRSLFMPGIDPRGSPDNVEQLYRVDVASGRSTVVPIRQMVNTKLRVGRSFPVLTKDNRQAYASRSGHLFRVNVTTGETEEKDIFQWTEPEILYSLALSPDGQTLAFGLPGKNSRPRLAVMPANGGIPNVIDPGPEVNLALGISWTPDGRHLLLVANDELMRFSLEEKRLQSTGLKVPGLSLPSLNPSGTQVLYQVSLPKTELWAIDFQALLVRIRR
ncbi:MAG: PD40 domain-containing protein [Acidobacteriia bacterium]|nr:PD40 domain-containing protein [Terriglobia bacterium]